MQRLVYEGDGGVAAIVVPAPDTGLSLDEVAARSVPAGKTYEVVEEADIPTDRTFRNAWKTDLTVDMPKARTIWRDKLRTERAALLIQLDSDYIRALEQSDAAELLRIAQRKQALRDAPADPRIEQATTPEQLKLITLP